MSIRWILASLHLLALGIGLGAVWARGRALRGPLDGAGVRRVLAADNAWGIAALLWLATGLVRLFGGLEKGLDYYLHSHAFLTKMTLFVVILALEIWPMATPHRLADPAEEGRPHRHEPGPDLRADQRRAGRAGGPDGLPRRRGRARARLRRLTPRGPPSTP